MRAKSVKKADTARGVASCLRDGDKGVFSSGGGLYLNVSGHNTGSWVYRYQIEGKRRRLGLGSVEFVSLAEARKKLITQRDLVAQGIDPLDNMEKLKILAASDVVTFDQVAADYIAAQRSSWTNAKHAQQWENTLATYASPVIGNLAPADITTEHLLQILSPIWNIKKETANRVRNRIELVLNAAKARKLRTGENVAVWRGHLDLLLTNYKKNKRRHHPALPWIQASKFWQALNIKQDVGSQALQLTMLTALRTSELLGAHWSEFDLTTKVWTVPAERMKGRANDEDGDHRVPLSTAALNLLATIPLVQSGLLFEGRTAGNQASNMVMLMKVRRMDATKYKQDLFGWRDSKGQVITPHGLRSTFRDWAAENTLTDNIVVEQALAHVIDSDVEKAYRRGDLLERRRELMETWGSYVTQLTANNTI